MRGAREISRGGEVGRSGAVSRSLAQRDQVDGAGEYVLELPGGSAAGPSGWPSGTIRIRPRRTDVSRI